MRLAASLSFGLAFALSGACSSPATEPVLPPASPAHPITLPDASPAPSQPAPLRSAALVPSPSLDLWRPPPPLLERRSHTPGKIQCETLDCDLATEVCCYDDSKHQARCVPNGGPAPLCGPREQLRACDESSDCSGGARCCREDHNGADGCEVGERWVCNPSGCGQSGDPSDELCLPGSTCARGACRENETRSYLQGLCPADTPPMACGAKRCAAGEFCCWTSIPRRGTCVKNTDDCPMSYEQGHSRKLFFCQSPADCATGECFNTSAESANQAFRCDVSKCHVMANFLGPRLCRSAADCPPEIQLRAMEMTMRTDYLTDCSGDPSFPPGIKVCHYRPGPTRFEP